MMADDGVDGGDRSSVVATGAARAGAQALDTSGDVIVNLEDAAVSSAAAAPAKLADSTIAREPYDSEKARDRTREMIAIWLLGTLGAVILLAFVTMITVMVASGASAKEAYGYLVGFLNIIFGPVVTLVGSAMGFYFGAQTGKAQALVDAAAMRARR